MAIASVLAKSTINKTQSTSSIASLLAKSKTSSATSTANVDTEYNKGGVVGGAKYVAGKVGTGALGLLEGAWDFTAGGIATLTGNKDYAEKLMADDITGRINQKLNEEYNPNKAMLFVGDVASGVGQSFAGVAVAAGVSAIVVASGGTVVPALASGVAAGTVGLGAAGQATAQAYAKTGTLGGKEFLYGAASGALESGTEMLFPGSTASISKRIVSPIAKQTAKQIVAKGVVKTIITDATKEAAQEMLQQFIDPPLQRALKIDPTMQNTTLQEALYVGATAFVSALITSGFAEGTTTVSNIQRGNKLMLQNKAADVITKSRQFSEIAKNAENQEFVAEPLKAINEKLTQYEAVENKNSNKAKMLLGEIAKYESWLEMSNGVTESKVKVIENAEAIAQSLSKQGAELTAQDIISNKDGVATKLAIQDFTAKLLIPEEQYTALVKKGEMVKSEANYQKWTESLTPEQKSELSAEIGIDFNTASYGDAVTAITEYKARLDSQQQTAQTSTTGAIKQPIKITEYEDEKAAKLAEMEKAKAKLAKKNRAKRIAEFKASQRSELLRTDDSIKIETPKAETNAVSAENAQTESKQLDMFDKFSVKNKDNVSNNNPVQRMQTRQAETQARQYVKDFDLLPVETRGKITEAIISGKQYGISAITINAISNIIAKRGIGISFSSRIKQNGVWSSDNKGNRTAFINPNTNVVEQTIIHELTHDLESTKGYEALERSAMALVSPDKIKTKTEQYTEYYKSIGKEIDQTIIDGEVTADFFAEFMLEKDFLTKQASIEDNRGFIQKAADWFKTFKANFTANEASRTASKLEAMYNAVVRGEAKGKSDKIRYSLTENDTNNIRFSLREEAPPKKTQTAYKVFNQREDGNLYPLYIIPDNDSAYVEVGKWYNADEGDYTVNEKGQKHVKAQGGLTSLAYRPGWHSGSVPFLDHIGVKGADGKLYLPRNFVWAEVEVSADKDYQSEADSKGTQARDKQLDYIPKDGYYLYRTNSNAAKDQSWYISGALRVVRILSDNEAYQISGKVTLRNSGITKDIKVSDKNGTIRPYKDTTRFSLPDTDSEGNKLSAGQREFFKDSKVVDDKGRLLKVYHGTNAEFNIFDINKSGKNWTDSQKGFYFTSSQISAKNYGAYIKKAYLNISNPMIMQANNEWYNAADYFDISAASHFQRAKDNKNDGIVIKHKNGDLYIAFSPNQIKLTTNLNPTENEDIRYSVSDTQNLVMTRTPESYAPPVKERIQDTWTAAQIQAVNAQAGIEKTGKRLGIKDIEATVQEARSANNAAVAMLGDIQYDFNGKKVGKGLELIFRPVKAKGEEYTSKFFDYLLNVHNVDRLKVAKSKYDRINGKDSYKNKMQELEQKLEYYKKNDKLEKAAQIEKEIEDLKYFNAVFYVSADESKAKAKAYEQSNPEFIDYAKEVYKYSDNLLQLRIDSKTTTQELADTLRKEYPHYVPTYRDTEKQLGTGGLQGMYNLGVKQTIKKAEGSNLPILPIDVMMSRQTLETVKAAYVNKLADSLYTGAIKNNDFSDIEVKNREKIATDEYAEIDYAQMEDKNNEISFFKDGEKVTMKVSKDIFAGFRAFSPSVEFTNPILKSLNKVNNLFKRLVTSLNPAFLVRNATRDLQDALLYSKYPKTFAKNYARAINEIKNNGEMWQLYRAKGGLSSSIFDFDKGITGRINKHGLTQAEGKILTKGFRLLENLNLIVEQTPRLAEFISTIEAGETAGQALLNSADITVNFSRSGLLGKKLNATIMPFLNPAIQGFSKMFRTVYTARSTKQIASLLIKVTLLGVVPQLLNQLAYEDDEDYKSLNDRDKENNFLFKIGDKFIKIPKGRVSSLFAGLTLRAGQTASGETADWKSYLSNALTQVSPVENMSRTILSPFSDVASNTTWYGTAIEGAKFENTEPKMRYDESTSSISIALGKVLNYSPKKIDYLLNSYSGVIGDFVLPATTKKAEKGFLEGSFTVNPIMQNKYSTKFYEALDKANYAKTNGDETAASQVRFLNNVANATSQLYKQKSIIQNSNLTDKEKIAETKVIQVLINEAYKTALNDLPLMTEAIKATSSIEDSDIAYTEATRLVYGAERALREYNKDVYTKAQNLNLGGIEYDIYYNVYFTAKYIESDKNEDGTTVSGSKKAKVQAYVDSIGLNTEQKLLLMFSMGYSDKTSATALKQYISKLKITKEQKIAIAEMCGFTVKDGKIY